MEVGDVVRIKPRLDADTTYQRYKNTITTITVIHDNLFNVSTNGHNWYSDELIPVTIQPIRKPVGGI